MLIDTSGWFCLLNENEARHEQASSYFNGAARLITHSYVIAELVALCESRGFSRSRTLTFVTELFDDASVEIVWVDEALTREASLLLSKRSDKRWSLCDAVSFAVMERRGLTDALTTDHHFEQAGFNRLLGL